MQRKTTFRKFGRSYQLEVTRAEDLTEVLQTDEALWATTSAAVDMVRADPDFLSYLDTDSNRRIMCFEVKTAVRWLLNVLTDLSGITTGADILRIDAISTRSDEARQIADTAAKILDLLAADDRDRVSLDQIRLAKKRIEMTPVSETGVVLPAATDDIKVRKFICDVLDTVGGLPHPGGSMGIDESKLNEFLGHARAYLDWRKQATIPDGQEASPIMPLGAETVGGFALLESLRAKIDQYFAQCKLLAFDRQLARLLGERKEPEGTVDLTDTEAIHTYLLRAPLSSPHARPTLSLDQDLNPRYVDAMMDFRDTVLNRLLDEEMTVLSEEAWDRITAQFAGYENWLRNKRGAPVEKLGETLLQEYLEPTYAGAVCSLIAEGTTTRSLLNKVRSVEKLLLYQMWMIRFVNNFVSFPYLFDEATRAMFEMGTLVLDSRRFKLSVRVENRAQHIGTAAMGNMFVVYAEVLQPSGQKYEVAVPVTAGRRGNLYVGKRGIFQDVAGSELNAQIVHIIENPIAIVEAVRAPFKRVTDLLAKKIEEMTAAAQARLDTVVKSSIPDTVVPAGGSAPAAPPTQQPVAAPEGIRSLGNMLVGGSIAIAALGSATAFITKTLAGLRWYSILIALAAAILAVLLPATILAFVKLRKRDLSSILEASGWAVNTRMRITFRQGRFFTLQPRVPGISRWKTWIRYVVLFAGGAVFGVAGWLLIRALVAGRR